MDANEQKQEVTLTPAEERKIEEIEVEEARIPEGILAAIANKYDAGKKEAILASARRVSKRMLLAARAKKITLVCPITGIVGLLDMPAIPGCFLPYEHPLSSLENARAITQRGPDYLKLLDTRTLAGILIVLAGAYDLFRFLPKDTGAEKNAILRTAGKETLIDALIIIETQIHSGNKKHCPVLSLLPDAIHHGNRDANIRLHSYLGLLTESIKTPDTSVYDENAKPKRIGRPVYIRDVEKAERKLSYLARLEQVAAKKELVADAKEAKKLAGNIVALGLLKEKFKPFISQLLHDDGMGLVQADKSIINMLIVQKLEPVAEDCKDVQRLIEILRKERKILTMELMEIDDVETSPVKDDPKPGQEDAVAEDSEIVQVEEEEQSEDSEEEELIAAGPIEPPAELSPLQRILWAKKHRVRTNKFSQPAPIPSTWVPTKKEEIKDEPLHFAGYSPDRLFLIYSNSKIRTGAYYVHADNGEAVFVLSTLPYGFRDL